MSDCILCKSNNINIFFKLKKFPLFFGAVDEKFIREVPKFDLNMAICNECYLFQQTDLVDENTMNSVYTAEYYNCPSPSSSEIGKREIHKFLNFFNENKLKKGTLLEVACFDGYLLDILQKDNWDIYGCDPATMTKIALEKFGAKKIKQEFLSENSYAGKQFDVIIFRNLLEHIYDINKFIQLIGKLLKEDGSIFIDLPNAKTIEQYGGYGLFFHQHISYFSIETMEHFLFLNNFEIINFKDESPNLFIQAKKSNNIKPKKLLNNFSYEKLLANNIHISKSIRNFFSKNKNIIFFGASALATTIFCFLDSDEKNKVKAIYDNESVKHNKLLQGTDIKIQNPSTLKAIGNQVIFITTFFFADQIFNQLIKIGIPEKSIIKIKDIL